MLFAIKPLTYTTALFKLRKNNKYCNMSENQTVIP